MGARRLAERRNAHEPLRRQVKGLAASVDKSVRVAWSHTGLLRLLAGIDLHIKLRRAALFLNLVSDNPQELFPVQGLDDIEKRHGVAGLIGLKRSDQMKRDAFSSPHPA